jgi:hypothetical protein
VSVPFATADKTARAPGDYTATTGTLRFAPGETTHTLAVPVRGELASEPNETFTVALGAPTGNATLGSPSVGTGTIIDDDIQPATQRTTPTVLVSVAPARDRRPPYVFVVSGRIRRPAGVGTSRGCQGRVRVIVRRGKQVMRTKRGAVSGTCRFKVGLNRLPKSFRLTISVGFLGNTALQPATSRTLSVRSG